MATVTHRAMNLSSLSSHTGRAMILQNPAGSDLPPTQYLPQDVLVGSTWGDHWPGYSKGATHKELCPCLQELMCKPLQNQELRLRDTCIGEDL